MVISLANLKLKPPVFLAPMAGITDKPSRDIAQLFNPGLVVSEMIASSEKDKSYFENKVKENLNSRGKNKNLCPTAIQIAGHEISWMTYAAKVIEDEGGDIIDINMGCPAKKIVGKLAGSALMKEPTHALKMLEAIVKSTTLPVTLKMRLGWDINTITAPKIAASAESLGIQMIIVHARTRNQFFGGKPNWSAVKKIKKLVSIPVIVNGDIIDFNSAQTAVKRSSADGLMIGRGAIGKPWLINQISDFLYAESKENNKINITMDELVKLHLEKILNFYGSEIGLRIFRKHLANYLRGLDLNSKLYRSVLTEESIRKLERMLKFLFKKEKVKVFHEKY